MSGYVLTVGFRCDIGLNDGVFGLYWCFACVGRLFIDGLVVVCSFVE